MRQMPTIEGTIERRILVNYRVDPDVLARLLPAPFRPQLVGGVGVAGICLIRLGHVRPHGMPAGVGVTTENAAHRVAVEWDGPGGPQCGVYIPRRDTSSRLTALVGGRLFPGEHHRARFHVRGGDGPYQVDFASLDGTAHVAVRARAVPDLPVSSVFESLAHASTFFQQAPLGYSATGRPGCFDGLELRCATWRVEALLVDHAESSFFDNEAMFPAGAAELDSALLMRDLPATWQACPQMDSMYPLEQVAAPGLRANDRLNTGQAARCE